MATYYLNADTGVDSGAGGAGAPWLTLAYAMTHSVTNDTIIFQDSTATYAMPDYPWNTPIGARTLSAAAVGDAVIDAGGASRTWNLVGTGLTLNLENLIFQNIVNTTSYHMFGLGYTGTYGTFNMTRCILRNSTNLSNFIGDNDLSNATYGTINLNSCILGPIGRNGAGYSAIITMKSSNCIGATINNCTIVSNAYGGTPIASIVPAGGGGYSYNLFWKNTIIYCTTVHPYQPSGYAVGHTVDYCCFYNVSGGVAIPTGSGNLTSDPLLVDYANANYKLRPTSPCIGTGTIL